MQTASQQQRNSHGCGNPQQFSKNTMQGIQYRKPPCKSQVNLQPQRQRFWWKCFLALFWPGCLFTIFLDIRLSSRCLREGSLPALYEMSASIPSINYNPLLPWYLHQRCYVCKREHEWKDVSSYAAFVYAFHTQILPKWQHSLAGSRSNKIWRKFS